MVFINNWTIFIKYNTIQYNTIIVILDALSQCPYMYVWCIHLEFVKNSIYFELLPLYQYYLNILPFLHNCFPYCRGLIERGRLTVSYVLLIYYYTWYTWFLFRKSTRVDVIKVCFCPQKRMSPLVPQTVVKGKKSI